MNKHVSSSENKAASTRRRFLGQLGHGAVAGGAAGGLLQDARLVTAADTPGEGRVKHRRLGTTDLMVSEVGFGGHSWSYKRTPDGSGGYRQLTLDEAVEMISAALDMGVNFFDSCTPLRECTLPGEALKKLKKRDQAVICVRPSHKMKGVENDKKEVYKWTEERLKAWQIDHIDLLLLSNVASVTDKSGYWDMSYSIEALDKLKKQGKIRYTGFGSHFTPKWFFVAFQKFGDYFDCCSMPYNVRHRVAEKVMPAAKKVGLGVITIKPFARGSILNKSILDENGNTDAARDMVAFVLKNKSLDVCLCGVHSMAHMKTDFSASWAKGISQSGYRRLEQIAATPVPHGEHSWLEEGWRCA